MVDLYSKQAIVEYAEPNFVDRGSWAPDDPGYFLQWHFGHINLEAAWDLDAILPAYGGDPSVVVAVVDSGVAYEAHDSYLRAPDLAGTLFVSGWDFVNNDAHPNDDRGHGTHVCGTIAQTTNNAAGVAGIAFNTAIMPVKTLDYEGNGSHAQMADGFYYATDHGAKIINYSAGGSHSITKQNAVAYAYNHGVLIIAAAGNDYEGENAPSYPAAYDDYCVAEGAVRYDASRS
jgi:serine protease